MAICGTRAVETDMFRARVAIHASARRGVENCAVAAPGAGHAEHEGRPGNGGGRGGGHWAELYVEE